jgi:hypothetical protein
MIFFTLASGPARKDCTQHSSPRARNPGAWQKFLRATCAAAQGMRELAGNG